MPAWIPGYPFACVFLGQEVGPGSRVAPGVDGLGSSGARCPLSFYLVGQSTDSTRCGGELPALGGLTPFFACAAVTAFRNARERISAGYSSAIAGQLISRLFRSTAESCLFRTPLFRGLKTT